jgi:hypothetical protein
MRVKRRMIMVRARVNRRKIKMEINGDEMKFWAEIR